jgi:thiol-disulfide isomerase/thioredoxin
MRTCGTCKGGSSWWFLLAIAVAIGVLAWRNGAGGVAPTPEVFDRAVTLDAALERAEESGKPVLALATADWCGPCQRLKRGALADERVAGVIAERTEPVYVDLTDMDDPVAADAARRLGIGPIPTLVLIEDGAEIARLEGAVGEPGLLDWLGANLDGE